MQFIFTSLLYSDVLYTTGIVQSSAAHYICIYSAVQCSAAHYIYVYTMQSSAVPYNMYIQISEISNF